MSKAILREWNSKRTQYKSLQAKLFKTSISSDLFKTRRAKLDELDAWINDNKAAAMRGLKELIEVKPPEKP